MSRVILKYALPVTGTEQISMPPGARFCHLGIQAHGNARRSPHRGLVEMRPVMWWAVPTKQMRRKDAADRWLDENPGEKIPQELSLFDWQLRTFTIAPTGGPGFADNVRYLGTFQVPEVVTDGSRERHVHDDLVFVGHVLAWDATLHEHGYWIGPVPERVRADA